MFPKMILHFDVMRDKSINALNEAMKVGRTIFLAAQDDNKIDDYDEKSDIATEEDISELIYKVGVVSEIKQIAKMPNDSMRVLVEGIYRASVQTVYNTGDYFEVDTIEHPLALDKTFNSDVKDALVRTIRYLFETYCIMSHKVPNEIIINTLFNENHVDLVDFIAGNIFLKTSDKQHILEQSSPMKRLKMLAEILEKENNILSIENEIQDKLKNSVDKNQREYYMREQIKILSEELGEDEKKQTDEYKYKIYQLHANEEVTEKLIKEVERLEKGSVNSHEATVVKTYIDTCLSLPWNKSTKDKIDLVKAKKQLDKDHYGLDKVKERILEILAVRKLTPNTKGQIICFAGPPGVGKTSIARSIAKAMGRKYVRMSLGGMRDESDIRGHRKTYIGAMPGRIINSIKLSGVNNPLLLLDEIDKLGNDFRGDPSSALLEVLDSEQNFAFRDHYIELPFDLSDTLFIATANNISAIPTPLLDRMDIITLTSYTREEKFQIAKRHLLSKQIKKHGLNSKLIKINDDAIYAMIDGYTREAGVRGLERVLASVSRKVAKKIVEEESKVTITGDNLGKYLGTIKYKREELDETDQIGVVNGLAWTSVGGEMLQIEVAVLEGSGQIKLTGSLGNVMKESAYAAVSYIRSCTSKYGIEQDFYKTKDIHIHVPDGAVPKDGPSAGVTICTALISALSDTKVKRDVAMTGEMTLRGRVLPIGGLKEKTMAAYRMGIKTVVVPKQNEPDIDDIDEIVKNSLRFVFADKIEMVLDTAFSQNFVLKNEKSAKTALPVIVEAPKQAIQTSTISQ